MLGVGPWPSIGAVDTLVEIAAARGIDPAKIGVGGDSAGGIMTCVIALKLRDENGPGLAVQVPLFPEAAFPADTLAASENRSGLYLESNGIFEMVRNLVKNTDDIRHPYITPLNAESHAGLPPAILVTNGFDPLRDVGHATRRPSSWPTTSKPKSADPITTWHEPA